MFPEPARSDKSDLSDQSDKSDLSDKSDGKSGHCIVAKDSFGNPRRANGSPKHGVLIKENEDLRFSLSAFFPLWLYGYVL